MAHAVAPTRHPQGKGGHIERVAEFAEIHELLFGDPKIIPIAGKMFFHHGERKRVVACRDRSVGREDRRRTDALGGFFEAYSRLHEFSCALEHHECSVAFVGVEDGGLNAQRAEHTHSADAEHDFLTDAVLLIAAV